MTIIVPKRTWKTFSLNSFWGYLLLEQAHKVAKTGEAESYCLKVLDDYQSESGKVDASAILELAHSNRRDKTLIGLQGND